MERTCKIPISRGRFAIVDNEDFQVMKKYYWRAVKSHSNFYAVRRIVREGRTITQRMHRIIAKTPPDQQCHHENHNTLDNRRENLSNMTEQEHSYIHGWR